MELSGDVARHFGLKPGTTFATANERLELVHLDDVERHRETAATAVKDGAGYVSRFRLIRAIGGKVVWLEERAQFAAGTADGEGRLSGVHMDIVCGWRRCWVSMRQTRDSTAG